MGRPAFHASILSMLSKCGEMARRRYIEGEKVPPGVELLIGTAVDHAVGGNLSSKAKTGRLLEPAAVEQLAADAFEREWKDPLLDEEERERGIEVVRGEAKDKSVQLAALHAHELAPKIEPLPATEALPSGGVQRRMRLELPGFPMDIEGTIDVEEARRIRDGKTTSKSPTGREAQGHPQLMLYSMMQSLHDSTAPKSVALDFLVKTAKPRAVVVEGDAPADFRPIVRRLEAAARVFETGAFYPVDPSGPSGWVCQPKWCGYYDRCIWGRRRTTQIAVKPGDSQ